MQIAADHHASPWSERFGADRARRRWSLICTALAATFTALFHHGWFFRSTCMLNDFGPDYRLDVLARWLSHDPSLLLGVLCALAVYGAGVRQPRLRPLALAFVLAFLPLSLWVWDVPFAGRPICASLHDGNIALRGFHLWALGGLGSCLGAVFSLRRAPGELAPTAATA